MLNVNHYGSLIKNSSFVEDKLTIVTSVKITLYLKAEETKMSKF